MAISNRENNVMYMGRCSKCHTFKHKLGNRILSQNEEADLVSSRSEHCEKNRNDSLTSVFLFKRKVAG